MQLIQHPFSIFTYIFSFSSLFTLQLIGFRSLVYHWSEVLIYASIRNQNVMEMDKIGFASSRRLNRNPRAESL